MGRGALLIALGFIAVSAVAGMRQAPDSPAPVRTIKAAAVHKVAASCDPHYVSDACVPIASDVDCAGGKGNGPAYIAGPFRYRGDDIYGLDRDHDGIACE